MTKTFKELIVWQKANELTMEIYRLTDHFPTSEQYGLINQMRRATVSIPSNIAEGYNRFHKKEKFQFMTIAFGSGGELESQIALSETLFPNLHYEKVKSLLQEVMKILNHFLNNRS